MLTPPAFSEPDCLRRLKLDDERAFDALFRHYSALVYRFAYSSRPAAEEIVQECHIKLWEKREQLHEDVPLATSGCTAAGCWACS